MLRIVLSRWMVLLAAALVLGGQATLGAQEPGTNREAAAALLAQVPDDFGLCLTLRDLRGASARITAAPWWKHLQASPLGKALLQSKELKDLLRIRSQLHRHLEVDWPALRDEVFGDAVVFAYRPGPHEGSAGEVGLFLLKTRNPDLLDRLLAKINDAQKRSGELKELERRELGRGFYWRRVQGEGTHYCFLEAGVFCLSNDEKLVRDILGRTLEGAQGSSRWWADLRRAGAEKALVSLAIGPRAFDAELQTQAAKAAGPEAAFLRQFRAAWAALDRAVLALQVHDKIAFDLTLLHRPSDLPATWRSFVQPPLDPSAIWKRFPPDPIVAVGGTFDASALWNFARGLAGNPDKNPLDGLERTAAAALGLDLVRDVLPNLGPDWGVCLLPAEKAGQPPRLLAAVAVRPGTEDPPVDQALMRGIEFLARFAVLEHNRTHADPIRLRSARVDGAEAKYLDGKALPPGLQPACALKNGYLLLSTSLSALSGFGTSEASTVAAGEATLLWFSAARLAREFRDNRTWHLEAIAARNGVSPARAGETLDGVLGVLDLFERVELTRSHAPDRWTWHLRIHLAAE